MAYIRRTKIVCTLGPSTSTPEAIRAIADAGMNVARLNFSHGTHADHAERIATVREVSREIGRPIAILGDLQGPRIRIGDLAQTIELHPGDDITLAPEEAAAGAEVPITYSDLATDVHVGDRILVDDGLLELVALEIRGARVTARVIHGGPLRSHKGINLPGVAVSAPSITDKDIADVEFAVEQDLDYLALSFVRRAEDITMLRDAASADDEHRREDREGFRAREHRGDRPCLGRRDGSARRSGRGAPIRGSSGRAEEDHRARQSYRSAGDHRDADARVDGHRTRAPRAPRRAMSPTRFSTVLMP